MANPFEALSAAAFKPVSQTFGADASWAPSGGGATLSARVIFTGAADPSRVDEVGPAPVEPAFEFKPSDLPGLYEAVRTGLTEVVTIDGTAHAVAQVYPIEDGTIYLALLAAT